MPGGGGPNLVGNPGFEVDTAGWGPVGSGITLQRVAGGHTGVAESMYMSRMCSAEPLRNKTIQRMSKDFARVTAKHLFGGAIEKEYSLLFVDGEDRIFRGLDYAA